MPRPRARILAARLAAVLTLAALAAGPVAAQESEAQAIQSEPGKAPPAPPADPATLRICASEKQPPLSMKDGSGLENRVAVAVAEAMGKKPVFVWLPKPAIYLVRDGLEKRTCDVVVGLDSDDPRVLTTRPYYRSGYVFITRADKDLDVKSWSDPRLKTLDHMVVPFGSPARRCSRISAATRRTWPTSTRW